MKEMVLDIMDNETTPIFSLSKEEIRKRTLKKKEKEKQIKYVTEFVQTGSKRLDPLEAFHQLFNARMISFVSFTVEEAAQITSKDTSQP